MEPVTVIVTALALGAASGCKSIAEQVVKDGYEGLKAVIKAKHPQISIDRLEQKPESMAQRAVIEEDISEVGGDKDLEILQKAKVVFEAVEKLPRDVVLLIGVDLENIKGYSLFIEEIVSTGAGVKVKGSDFQGDITIKNVKAGEKDNPK